MFDTSAPNQSEASLLLWMLAASVAVFAAYVGLGWIRESRRETGWRNQWKGMLLAAGSLGAGMSASMVLALSAEPLSFPLGYPMSRAIGLWPVIMLACLPACVWLVVRRGILANLGGGLLLAAVAVFTQAAWLDSVGFRPGVLWRAEFMAGAAVLLSLGLVAGVWVSYSEGATNSNRRRLWRLGGGVLFGLTLVAAQEVFIAGAGLLAQVGSVYKSHVPAALLSLFGGVVVPLVLAVMAVDLEVRRRQRRRHRRKSGSAPSTVMGATWGDQSRKALPVGLPAPRSATFAGGEAGAGVGAASMAVHGRSTAGAPSPRPRKRRRSGKSGAGASQAAGHGAAAPTPAEPRTGAASAPDASPAMPVAPAASQAGAATLESAAQPAAAVTADPPPGR